MRMSRLDGLFLLLSTSTSTSARDLAAKQLGEIQRRHPHELHSLLSRLHPLLQSASWETRMAAAKALGAIVSEVPQCKGQQIRAAKTQDDVSDTYKDISIARIVSLSDELDREKKTADPESEEVDAPEEQMRRLNSHLGLDVAAKLGVIDASDLLSQDDLKLSNREKNILRRKKKAELKKRISSQSPRSASPKRRRAEAKVELYSFSELDEIEFKGKWPLSKFCDALKSDLFHSSWEVRHGAASALKEIIQLHGHEAGRMYCEDELQSDVAHQRWLSDTAFRLLSVLYRDRFGDFVSDEMVAPIRESCALALGSLIVFLPATALQSVVDVLLCLLNHAEWQTRHGGMLGLKYLLAVATSRDPDLLRSLPKIYPAIFSRLSDQVDDVVAASAAALLPVINVLLDGQGDLGQSVVADLSKKLSDILEELDDLSGSTKSVMKLLELILEKKGVAAMGLDPPIVVRRLIPYLHHSSGSVRLSCLKTLRSSLTNASCELYSSICSVAMAHLYQRALLEHQEECLRLIEHVWFQICDHCPLQPLLMTTCPVYGSWLATIQKPPNFPLPPDLLLPVSALQNNWTYLGGQEAQQTSDGQERDRLATRARCLAAKLLGKLAGFVARPVPGMDYTQETLTPIEMFVEKVMLPSLQGHSAYQMAAVGLVVIAWSQLHSEQVTSQLPQCLKDKLLEKVVTEEAYDETMGLFAEMSGVASSLVSKLKAINVPVQEPPSLAHFHEGLEFARTVSSLPLQCRSRKLLEELKGLQRDIQDFLLKIQQLDSSLSILVKGVLAGSLVGVQAIPDKLNPVIKPLMESMKREPKFQIQTLLAHSLAQLLDICLQRRMTSPCEKLMRNLMFFVCSDPTNTPPIGGSDQSIITWHRFQRCMAKSGKADGESGTPPEAIQCRGASEALKAIVNFFAERLPEKVPFFWSWTVEAVKAPDHLTGQDLLHSLQVLEICAPFMSPKLWPLLEAVLPDLCRLLGHELSCVRHLTSRCLAVLAKPSMLNSAVMTVVVNDIVPLLEESQVHQRRGAMEAVCCVIHALDVGDIVPYIVLLILPVLGRMSDQDDAVRQLASSTFATLIRLIPLDGADDYKLPVGVLERKKQDAGFLDELMNIKKVALYPVPLGIKASLRPYQQQGLNWLAFLNRYRLHGILCDDMGLGKTIQAICILAGDHLEQRAKIEAVAEQRAISSLVVCPATLCGHWEAEMLQHTDQGLLRPYVYSGNASSRHELQPSLRACIERDKLANLVVISSYEVVRNDIIFFAKFAWNYLILDEGHCIRNPKAKTTLAIKSLKANHRLILSGTPIQNSALELWSLFDFLMPGFLGTERQFNARYCRPIIAARGSSCSAENRKVGLLAMESLHRQVLPFILRRVKDDVLKDLPPKITQDYYCDLSPVQVMLYETFAQKQRGKVDDGTATTAATAAASTATTHIFQALQYLRKVCNHPKLVLNEEHDQLPDVMRWLADNKTNLDDIQIAAKLPALKQLLSECGIGSNADVVSQHRVLLFCQLKSMMDIVEKELLKKEMPSVSYIRLDGSVPANCRMSLVNRFNNDPSIDLFLLSTSVGGLGLNLVGADTVIFLEHDWNPMKDLQAMDRAHRIGQTKVVNVYRLITRNTIEEKILGLQKFKLKTVNTLITKDNASLDTMGREQIFDLFSLDSAKGAAHSSPTDQHKKEAARGLKSILESLPELWDETEYNEAYSLDKVG